MTATSRAPAPSSWRAWFCATTLSSFIDCNNRWGTRPFMASTNQVQSEASVAFWSWLFPVTYIFHIAEEYWGGEGYPAYLLRLRGVYLSPTRFLFDQALGLALVLAGIIIAR